MRGTDVERFNTEVGYWLAEPYWNQGIMGEALREAMYLYGGNSDVKRWFAQVYEGTWLPCVSLKK